VVALGPRRSNIPKEKEAPVTILADPEALAREAHQRLVQLREQESRLSLDSLTDPDARARLDEVETGIASCELELRRAALAETERERREEEAKAQAEEARKAKLVAQADRLSARLPAAAQAVDHAAAQLARAVKAHHTIAQDELRLRIDAGSLAPTVTLGRPYDAALRHAMAVAGVDHALEPVPMGPPGPRPMCPDDQQQTQTSRKE
jgi:hypothetical protein